MTKGELLANKDFQDAPNDIDVWMQMPSYQTGFAPENDQALAAPIESVRQIRVFRNDFLVITSSYEPETNPLVVRACVACGITIAKDWRYCPIYGGRTAID